MNEGTLLLDPSQSLSKLLLPASSRSPRITVKKTIFLIFWNFIMNYEKLSNLMLRIFLRACSTRKKVWWKVLRSSSWKTVKVLPDAPDLSELFLFIVLVNFCVHHPNKRCIATYIYLVDLKIWCRRRKEWCSSWKQQTMELLRHEEGSLSLLLLLDSPYLTILNLWYYFHPCGWFEEQGFLSLKHLFTFSPGWLTRSVYFSWLEPHG